MLSRTAAALYWIGRYVERAEFTARLVEATLRLDALSARPAGRQAWESALRVTACDDSFAATGQPVAPEPVSGYLTLDPENPGSIRACLDSARDNAKSVRTALTRDAWEAINRAWLGLRGLATTGGYAETLALIEMIRAETRGFEGALQRMLRNEAYAFIGMGAAIERADNTARLIDVKYHLLLPVGEKVGGLVDRDQWTTILHTVSANTAYRWLYRDGLKPWLVADMLILRPELPRSLAGATEEVAAHLAFVGKRLGRQGEADRMARRRVTMLSRTKIDSVFGQGLHEYLEAFVVENASLDRAIAEQFRFA
ncbi:alpha-E domain-containing protein [Sphingomonas nostoxanthinifaciens]|uniref:alpha-E domain-containing protein n=1 Tax=Sphingomonas nostoxanthinifaciens TaxID=2872652 RepID=UPI001CC1DAD0|nr:alpha-E domain-containing protein [Sphingomonas nostoxanthinifaciens]UAK24688.1 alpha-E domain-containing protein [Sphingomonas nostoxanthinifaciens]